VPRARHAATLYRRTAAVFAVSRVIESRCREIGIPPERIFWIPGVVDLTRFTASADGTPIREEFKLGDAPVVASVARMATNRGHELLLSGFRLLVNAMPRVRLLLVGKGERRRRLEQLVAELGLGGHVVFRGYRDADLPAVLAAADCFALMAAGSDESCRAALEAMAAARPVIARRVGALPETVGHGETGLLVDDDRPESVAQALQTLLGDPERGRPAGRAGCARRCERSRASGRRTRAGVAAGGCRGRSCAWRARARGPGPGPGGGGRGSSGGAGAAGTQSAPPGGGPRASRLRPSSRA